MPLCAKAVVSSKTCTSIRTIDILICTRSKFYGKSIGEVGFWTTAHFGGQNADYRPFGATDEPIQPTEFTISTAKMGGKTKSDFTNRFVIKFRPCIYKDVYSSDICKGFA